MDLVAKTDAEYEQFKIAKEVVAFAFRCHDLDLALGRVTDVLKMVNEFAVTAGHLQEEIRIPFGIEDIRYDLNYGYFNNYKNTLSKHCYLEGIEWPHSLLQGNRGGSEFPGAKELLGGFSPEEQVVLFKTMLLDLADEAESLFEEHQRIMGTFADPKGGIVCRVLSSIAEAEKKEAEEAKEALTEALESGEESRISAAKRNAMTPFEVISLCVEEWLLPGVNEVLGSIS